MCRRELLLTGILQGVGFRPFVYRLATSLDLSGYVQNSSDGVQIFIEGEQQQIDAFKKELEASLPPLARIDSLEEKELPRLFAQGFEIKESSKSGKKTAFLPPDIALCDACLNELNDPASRFYRYPFTTCTDCGPRYSIIHTVPYDRPNTAMADFTLCPECQESYDDPMDRRYHAQPLACPQCGPTLSFKVGATAIAQGDDALRRLADLLKEGKTGAMKGIGGFHLLCDATSDRAVGLLRKRKKRPTKPLALLFKNLAHANAYVSLDAAQEKLLLAKERPILLIDKPENSALAEGLAPGIDRLGIMLAYTPQQHLLFDKLSFPLVATSANVSDAPIAKDAQTLISQLGSTVDGYLDYNREIVNACDDSLIQAVADTQQILRMGRGFAPKSIRLPFKSGKNILAVGAHQKNSIAIVMEDTLILSPYIGDLNSLESFGYFERTLKTLQSFYDFTPDLIVHDTHPGYQTTRWAKEQSLPTMHLQHHHAHLLAAMAEWNLTTPVLGFAFDGTGYGDDGSIWGSEVMRADLNGYERLFCLEPFRLLGGDLAVKEPRRCALALLFEHFALADILAMDNPTTRSFSKTEIQNLHVAWQKGLNAPKASSFGRLFDAAASLSGIQQESSYEGESGLLIEAACDLCETGHYPFSLQEGQIRLEAFLHAMLMDYDRGNGALIPSRFLNSVAAMITQLAALYPELPVVLSGGVFQNRTLLEKVCARFEEVGREYHFQQTTPVNDGGIALGQAYKAAWEHQV